MVEILRKNEWKRMKGDPGKQSVISVDLVLFQMPYGSEILTQCSLCEHGPVLFALHLWCLKILYWFIDSHMKNVSYIISIGHDELWQPHTPVLAVPRWRSETSTVSVPIPSFITTTLPFDGTDWFHLVLNVIWMELHSTEK